MSSEYQHRNISSREDILSLMMTEAKLSVKRFYNTTLIADLPYNEDLTLREIKIQVCKDMIQAFQDVLEDICNDEYS